jgi:hypothetical protein
MKQVGQRPDLGHRLLGEPHAFGKGAAFAVAETVGRPVQLGEEHLQAGKILGGCFVQHLRDSPALVVLRAHQPPGQRAHLIVRVIQLAFRRLTVGNVLVDDNRSRDAVVRVPDRDRRVLDDLPDPVERLDLDDFIDGRFAVDEGAHRCPLFRREYLSGGVPPAFAFGVPLASGAYRRTPDPLRSRIAEDDIPGKIDDRDANRERIHDQPQEALAPLQPFLGALPIGNILKAIHRSVHLAVCISQGDDIHQHRQARSVGPLYHHFQIAGLDSGPEHLRHFRFLVGYQRAVGRIQP